MSALISSILWEHLLPMHFCRFVADISAVNLFVFIRMCFIKEMLVNYMHAGFLI